MQAQLQNTEHHFVRLLLLCHQSNALAAARNTAFEQHKRLGVLCLILITLFIQRL